jgi:hypothetical protein
MPLMSYSSLQFRHLVNLWTPDHFPQAFVRSLSPIERQDLEHPHLRVSMYLYVR